MGEGKLTAHFGDQLVERIAERFETVSSRFPRRRFIDTVGGLSELGLMARVDRIGTALGAALPPEPERAWKLMRATLPPPLPPEGQTFNDGYWMLPLAAYWPLHHLDHPEVSTVALAELTQRGTAEFALRPFLEAHPERLTPTVEAWALHPSFHVRRLASEGTRPRLPWKGKLRVPVEIARQYFRGIRLLANDPSSYVRRSVGNHARDFRALDEEEVEEWLSRTALPADVRKLAEKRSNSA